MNLRVTVSSLTMHWKRLLPGLAGAALGALALAGTVHLSSAMVLKAEQETAKLGPNLLVAMAGKARFLRSGKVLSDDARTFTPEDAAALCDGLPLAEACAPFVSTALNIRSGQTRVPCRLVGTTTHYPGVRAFVPEHDRFFTPDEQTANERVCVLGRSIATLLFTDPVRAVGGHVAIGRVPLRVVGVMEEKGADLSGADQDEQVFVPLNVYLRTLAPQTWINGAYVRLRAPENGARLTDRAVADTVNSAQALLLARHGDTADGRAGDADFTVFPASQARQVRKQALQLVWALGLSGALVSFSIGSLGILSLMLLMVRARRLEIGLRRTTGARQRDILRLFLVESALLGGGGGLLGVLSFVALSPLLSSLADLPHVIYPTVLAGVCALSALIGVCAGTYPAWQASRLQILDILREYS